MSNFKKLRDELTNDNNHTDSLMIECIEMARYDVLKELSDLAITHTEQGFLTKEQQDYRDVTLVNHLVNGTKV